VNGKVTFKVGPTYSAVNMFYNSHFAIVDAEESFYIFKVTIVDKHSNTTWPADVSELERNKNRKLKNKIPREIATPK